MHNPDEPALPMLQTGQGRNQRGKIFLYPDFTNRPDQISNDLNPGDSANPNTNKKSLFFAKTSLVILHP
jgi:hypothetical protein